MVSTSLWWTRNTIVELLSYQVWATNQPCKMAILIYNGGIGNCHSDIHMTVLMVMVTLIFMWQWRRCYSPCWPVSSPSRPSCTIEFQLHRKLQSHKRSNTGPKFKHQSNEKPAASLLSGVWLLSQVGVQALHIVHHYVTRNRWKITLTIASQNVLYWKYQ